MEIAIFFPLFGTSPVTETTIVFLDQARWTYYMLSKNRKQRFSGHGHCTAGLFIYPTDQQSQYQITLDSTVMPNHFPR